MSYWHALYRPYAIGERVHVILEGEDVGKNGVVFHLEPEDAFDALECAYYVQFDGEEHACQFAFGYWDLEPLS